MENFGDLGRIEQEASLMLPILKALRRLGGRSTTQELKRSVVTNEEWLPETVLTDLKVSKRSGHQYRDFDFPFNFALRHLALAEYISRPKRGQVVLLEKGREFKGTNELLNEQVYQISRPKWQEIVEQKKRIQRKEKVPEEVEELEEAWRTNLLMALNNLTPAKFELFCRALMKQMNIAVDENIGVKVSGDGGIDGYGYLTTDDFRTTRVALQAKRWNDQKLVSSPEIDKFRGAMDKYRAEYGIFITTSSFTRDAIRASREGTRVVTLIDGERLLDLIAKYELYVTPVVTYELDDFFTTES